MNDSADLMCSHLVWDGAMGIQIPPDMGQPAPGQLEGTAGERLSELCGRICYDSLGKGRSSADYHKHIKEVNHGSVYEHFHMTVLLKHQRWSLETFLNRPGIWVRPTDYGIRVTLNPRVLLDWSQFGTQDEMARLVLQLYMADACPQIVERPTSDLDWAYGHGQVVEPETDDERWVSLFMSGSRGFSHELVRHGDFTAISQRSTRFVDESESPWVDHPLVREYMRHPEVAPIDRESMRVVLDEVKDPAKATYAFVVEKLQPWLISRGVDKVTARKQARGAARGYLGNALYTELIFSASVAQWKRMIRMRACAAADAEIRAVFVKALSELRRSRYAGSFAAFEVAPAPDGIGEVVTEGAWALR